MTQALKEREMRNLTDEKVLLALETAIPKKLSYKQLHKATGIHSRRTLWNSTKRLEALGFITASFRPELNHQMKTYQFKVFAVNGPVLEIAVQDNLNRFFQDLDLNEMLVCRQLDHTITQQYRVVDRCWDPEGGCLTGCRTRIQCFHDNKDGEQ